MTVFILATLDTKGREAAFVRDELAALGVSSQLVDTGCLGAAVVPADIARDAIYGAAGVSIAELVAQRDRGAAVNAAANGAAKWIAARHAAGEVSGVFGLGGSAGTTIGTAAMRALPIGIPKVMVSTLASGQVRPYVGDKDILMQNAVVDIAGINRLSRQILGQAARAMAGMVLHPVPQSTEHDRPLVVASMFGVTTPCVERARCVLEAAGYEVIVFHATGAGGRALESLVHDGLVTGVLDITTTELADELVGGVLSAGPDRLTAAAKHGVPQVISVGALDMVNFGARDSVPHRFHERTFYEHNATVTLMRTTAEECRQLGAELGLKAQSSIGPVAIFLPQRGISAIDRAGQPFEDPHAREVLFEAIRQHAGDAPLFELDLHINDAAFAEAMAESLLAMMARLKTSGIKSTE